MKEKLLQFFTGKMSKTIYISIAAAVVCGAVVITSTVIVHNNNQKIDSVLESLAASESVAELSSESVTESISDTDNTDSGAQAKAQNGEPAGDKALQYLAEYDKLTKEYERKRAELVAQTPTMKSIPLKPISEKPQRKIYYGSPSESSESIAKKQAELDAEYERELAKWENENAKYEREISLQEQKNDDARGNGEKLQQQIAELDTQYEKDIAALKERYGII